MLSPRTPTLILLLTCSAFMSPFSPALLRHVRAAPTTAPATTDFYAMTAAAFFAADAAQAPLDPGQIDHRLMSAAIFHESNRVRGEHGLAALTYSPQLEAASRMHAIDMAEANFFAHENPNDASKREPADRVKLSGYDPRYVAENLATAFDLQYEPGREFYVVPGGISYDPNGRPLPPHTYASFARHVVERWMNSPGHRANLLAVEPTELGAAAVLQPRKKDDVLATFNCVQVFGAPMAPPTRPRRR